MVVEWKRRRTIIQQGKEMALYSWLVRRLCKLSFESRDLVQ